MRTLSIIFILFMSTVSFGQEPQNSNLKSILGAMKKGKEQPRKELPSYTNIAWEPIVEMDDKIYPSYVWAMNICNYLSNQTPDPSMKYYGDSEGQIGVAFVNRSDMPVIVKLTIEADAILRKSEYTFIASSNQYTEVFPEIDYRFDVMENNYQPRPVRVNYTLTVGGEEVYKKSKNITLMSIYDCPYVFEHRSGYTLDQSFMFAAYVNENHPKIVHEILPEITDTKIVNSITGYLSYNGGDSKAGFQAVLRQVFGMWIVLKDRNIKYSSITGPSTSNKVTSQHVRTVGQSLRSTHANCIDGTVLMASILYKMGIEPQIVIVPGHAYLGFYIQPEGSQERLAFYLETTMLGSSVNESDLTKEVTDVGNLIANDEILTNHRNDFISFLGALQVASADFEKNEALFNRTDIRYRLFEVDAWRKKGVLPLSH